MFTVSYTHLRAHETEADLVCRLLLEKIKIKTRPSEGNFSFVEMSEEEAKKIFAHLANSGIIVRQLVSYGLPNCLRITIGTREEMEATINSLKGL